MNQTTDCMAKPDPDQQQRCYYCHDQQCNTWITAGGRMICIVAKGEVAINLNACEVHLDNGLYLPDASRNLVSVWALANDSICGNMWCITISIEVSTDHCQHSVQR
ncbi:hypothetical protein NDA11_007325 [Ustilago hordei]|nr:hypothetical protein NDA15_007580 [Ustilago hordei]KAJ1582890.1 hypothetical protein NDA12_005037 [Ustilago hordei]KAJ1588838.1 hypothetical protein NDA11_007325 [Ustilago hordei]